MVGIYYCIYNIAYVIYIIDKSIGYSSKTMGIYDYDIF